MNDWTDPAERPAADIARRELPTLMRDIALATDAADTHASRLRLLGLKAAGTLAAIVGHSIVPEQPVTFSLQITLPNGYWQRLERAIATLLAENPAMSQDEACNDIFEAGMSAVLGENGFEFEDKMEEAACHAAK